MCTCFFLLLLFMVSSVSPPVRLDMGHNCHISHLQYITGLKALWGHIVHISTVSVLQVKSLSSTNAGSPKVWLYKAIVLSCPLIDCWATERANLRATQNNFYNIKPDFWVPGFVLLKLCYLYETFFCDITFKLLKNLIKLWCMTVQVAISN